MSERKGWPHFFVVGEPRSGTTSLHDLLAQHPDIYMSQVKEPHYFSEIQFPSPDNEVLQITRDEQGYLALFAEAAAGQLRGESSTYYLADPASPRLLHDALPEAKLIAVLRDPIDRAYSHYLLYNRRGNQKKSFYETVQYNIETPNDQQDLTYNLVELGRYHKHVSNYLKYFSKNRLLVLLTDDLHKRPQETLEQIFEFLGADKNQASKIQPGEAQNSYSRPRNQISSFLLANKTITSVGLKLLPRPLLQKLRYGVLLKQDSKPLLDPRAKALLRQAYEPEVRQLEKLLERDLNVLRRSWES